MLNSKLPTFLVALAFVSTMSSLAIGGMSVAAYAGNEATTEIASSADAGNIAQNVHQSICSHVGTLGAKDASRVSRQAI